MVSVERFKTEHIKLIKKQNHDVIELRSFTDEQFQYAERLAHSYTIFVNGVAVACVGVAEYWRHRGEAFAFISSDSGKHFVSIVRTMKRLIDEVDCDRIEATVIRSFKQGHRLVRLLGFELEADLMRKYGLTGLDYSLYARVK